MNRQLRRVVLPLLLGLSGCAITLNNAPRNLPVTPAFTRSYEQARLSSPDEYAIGLSFSGGGMRAAAFSLGVLQTLTASGPEGRDLFDDIAFISGVSGGSLTAAYVGLHGREGVDDFRAAVLDRDFEHELRRSIWPPTNLLRLLAGGLNDRGNLSTSLDRDVFHGATFADLYRRAKPNIWINATDLYNRTSFPFIPPLFLGLCSDLSQLSVSEAVAASMAVPLIFAPVVLKTYPDDCLTPQPPWLDAAADDPGGVVTSNVTASARALRNYRDARRMRYVHLADGGISDNQGLTSLLIFRAVSGTPYGPLTEQDAVRLHRFLMLIVDAGRTPSGDWAGDARKPSAVDLTLAAADTMIDSTTRLSAAAFKADLAAWREAIVKLRCGLSPAQVAADLERPAQGWRCDDVAFDIGIVSIENLGPERAVPLRDIPTRLLLPQAQVELIIAAGRDAAAVNPALKAYLAGR